MQHRDPNDLIASGGIGSEPGAHPSWTSSYTAAYSTTAATKAAGPSPASPSLSAVHYAQQSANAARSKDINATTSTINLSSGSQPTTTMTLMPGDGGYTVCAAMESAIAQCQQRCLTDTATWLGEMQLDAVPQLLVESIHKSSLLSALLNREVAMTSSATGKRMEGAIAMPVASSGLVAARTRARATPFLSSSSSAGIDNNNNNSNATHFERWRGYHRVAVGLFHKAEYQRCHHLLMKAIQELDTLSKKRARPTGQSGSSVNRAETVTESGEGEERESDAEASGGPHRDRDRYRRRASVPSTTTAPTATATTPHHRKADDGAAGGEPEPRRDLIASAASFATTRLPPCLSFLCLYALYMDGQKTRTTSANPHRTRNPHLRVLRVLLLEALRNPANHLASYKDSAFIHSSQMSSSSSMAASRTPLQTTTPDMTMPASSSSSSSLSSSLSDCDPYLGWLTGVVLRDLGLKQESATYFLASVRGNPLLWCAWQDMNTLVSREAQLEEIAVALADLEPRFMLEVFLAVGKASLGITPLTSTAVNLFSSSPSTSPAHQPPQPQQRHIQQQTPSSPSSSSRRVNTWELLLRELFPNNLFLLGQLAGFHHHQQKDLDRAERLYQQVHKADPYRLDCVAEYSNLLFMKSDRLGLANLAQKTYNTAPFRAESNFVVGNYYVLLGQHDRSVLHFRRAVAVEPGFVAAWTLLGHAYVETRNTTAAVEAYRTAVELDPRDYRGWYNLGQIYELLQAYHHALYYYWQTTSLRPMDPRMWTAVANCLEHEGRLGESAACLERAAAHEPVSSELYPALAKRISTYYINTRAFAKACTYLEKLVASRAAPQDDLLFALPFLIQFNIQQSHHVVELPARSPSYEPSTMAEQGVGARMGTGPSPYSAHNHRNSSAAGGGHHRSSPSFHHTQSQQQQSNVSSAGVEVDTTAEETDFPTAAALRYLTVAEGHLATLAALAGGTDTTAGATAASSAPSSAAEEDGEEGLYETTAGERRTTLVGVGLADLAEEETAEERATYHDNNTGNHYGGKARRGGGGSSTNSAAAGTTRAHPQQQRQSTSSWRGGTSPREQQQQQQQQQQQNHVTKFIDEMKRKVEMNRHLIRLQRRQ